LSSLVVTAQISYASESDRYSQWRDNITTPRTRFSFATFSPVSGQKIT
jgi:hypothetical protein